MPVTEGCSTPHRGQEIDRTVGSPSNENKAQSARTGRPPRERPYRTPRHRAADLARQRERRSWLFTLASAHTGMCWSVWSCLHGVEPPWVGDALEVVFAAVDEADVGPGDEIDDGP
jgi:hypothetical protein